MISSYPLHWYVPWGRKISVWVENFIMPTALKVVNDTSANAIEYLRRNEE